MIVFACPTCRNALQVPPEMAGQPVTCVFCHQVVVVPYAPAPLAPAPAPAPPPAPPEPNPLAFDDPKDEDANEKKDRDEEDEDGEEEEGQTRARQRQLEAAQGRDKAIYTWGGAALALIGVVCAIALAPMMMRDSKGTHKITTAELLELKDPATLPSPWVSYTTEGPTVETNIAVETKSRRGGKGTIKTRFVLVPVKDKWLIAERNANATSKTLEGELGKWELGLGPEAVARIKAEHPDKKDKLLPFQLSEAEDATTRVIAMGAGVGFVILFGLGCTIYGLTMKPRVRPGARSYR